MICAGQLSREEALEVVIKPAYDYKGVNEDLEYVLKKFGFSKKEFEQIMSEKPKKHTDYLTYTKKHYKYEIYISKLLRPFTRPLKRVLGIKVENNIV